MGHKLLFLCAFAIGLAPAGACASLPRDATPATYALDALGVHYRYGGRSPDTGFDCSGLVAHAFKRAWGIELPRNARAQARIGTPIRHLRDLQPGDLVFYNTRNSPYSHVGLYLGDRRFIHAPRPGQRVRTDSVDNPYWRARFNGGRRLERPNDNDSH